MAEPRKTRQDLRMNELVKATGVPRSTILFYLSQGLLPPPEKTSTNMSYYDPSCVDRIRRIRQLQARHRFSLGEIRKLLEALPDPSALSLGVELHEIVFGRESPGRAVRAREFLRETGLTKDRLALLRKARLLQPLKPDLYDPEDLEMGRIFFRALEAGVRVEELAYYVEYGERIIDREMALRSRMTRALPVSEDATITIQMVKDARRCRAYVLDRLFQHRVASMRGLKE